MTIKTKDPAESVVVAFDFSSELPLPASAVVSISVAGGTPDPAVASTLVGAHQISGSDVLQRFAGGVSGARYKLRCVGTRGDDVIVRSEIVEVRAK